MCRSNILVLYSALLPVDGCFTSAVSREASGHKKNKKRERLPLTNSSQHCLLNTMYRVSIKSFPDYKNLIQENYVEFRHFFLP